MWDLIVSVPDHCLSFLLCGVYYEVFRGDLPFHLGKLPIASNAQG